MVLKPLEFSECLADSPWFRENLREHEESLEFATKKIKGIEQHCRKLISCTIKLSQAQKAFATALNEFKIETVGTTQTDDERIIANSLKEFGQLILQIEEERSKIIEEAEQRFFEPLQKLADGVSKVARDEKHKYNKESNRFYTGLEKHLHLSTVRKNDFREADAQLGQQQKNFCQASLQYVAEIQAVQERIKFEFVETLSSFLYEWLSFYHVGFVIHKDFCGFYDGINTKVQKAKENFATTQAEAKELKDKMLISHMKNAVFSSSMSSTPSDVTIRPTNCNIKQGYIYLQEKSIIPKTISRDVLPRNWTKYYCVYSKESRIFTMIPANNSSKTNMKGTLEQSVSFKLKSCVRRASDSIDKRFCFDVISDSERSEVMTFQALSEEDRRQWLDAMDGREPVYSPGTGPPSVGTFDTMLDDNGFDFVRQCLRTIEEQGIREQGIYRNCGVTSKVQRLMQIALDKRKNSTEKLNLTDDSEWETKTISSAIKTFLRNLPEPLMTFDLHHHFINAAKMGDIVQRVNHIHYYVYKLPEVHRQMLELIIRHLRRVADISNENRMTVGNLGVCFGPTLLRPKEETMAAIMDIKFCNVVVEVLITNCVQIFDTQPPQQIGVPCPPKPSHNLVAIMPPVNELSNVSLTSLKNTPASSSDTLNNQKSISTDCFLNTYSANTGTLNRSAGASSRGGTPPSMRSANSTTLSSHNENDKPTLSTTSINQMTGQATVRQRQPPPPPPTLPRLGASNSSGIKSSTGTPDCSNLSSTSASFCSLYPSTALNNNIFFNNSLSATNSRTLANNSANCRTTFNDNSSESLNSVSSSSSLSGPALFHLHQSNLQQTSSGASSQIGGSATSAFTKTKMTASYAPSYNPFACDNITYRLQKRHSGGNLLLSSSAHSNLAHLAPQAGGVPTVSTSSDGNNTTNKNCDLSTGHQPATTTADTSSSQSSSNSGGQAFAARIPQAYSNFINPNVQFQPRRVRTLYLCTAGHETELSFEPGQIITNVYESKEEGWLVGTLNGKTGLIPANYVEHILGP